MIKRSMTHTQRVLLALLVALFCISGRAEATETASKPLSAEKLRNIPLLKQRWTADFDQMLKKHVIRVAVPYSRTLYYLDKGHERGISAENVRYFEEFLNKKYKKQLKRRPLTVYMVPVTRDKLLDAVTTGAADIAVGNLTITEERMKDVDFVSFSIGNINEIVVTGPGAPQLTSVDDLAGQTVHVRPASSYYESLQALNKRLLAKDKAPVRLVLLPDALEDEDVLEMLNVGIFNIVVMDNWKANIWAQLLPNTRLHEQLILRSDSTIGWAIRKQSPALQRELTEFFSVINRQHTLNNRYKQLMKKVKGFKNNATDKELEKFEQMIAAFEKYGLKYKFDPLLLAAQGYQESRLDQNARSHVGAIGVMQLMPSTGSAMKVGNIRVTEPNIHAGTKYLDHLMSRYFSDADFTELDRAMFAFAAYNAGPGTIARMRKEAGKRGLDPNVWFNNVEIVTAEKIGSETTTYVRNVYKYYAAYKLVQDRDKEQKDARKQLHSSSANGLTVR